MTGRRIRTQQEADELNAMGFYDARTGKRVVFVVSTPESEWAEFCEVWPRIAKAACIVREAAIDALRHTAYAFGCMAQGDVEQAKKHSDYAAQIASELPGNLKPPAR